MKKNLLMLLMLSLSYACDTEDNTPTTPVVDDPFDESTATLVSTGNIMGVNHTVSGTASIFESNGKYVVVLDPFSSQNGPDLKVYFSKDVKASAYLRLGDLKSTMGRQSYTIPDNTDISQYEYVHIWCEKFSVEFARAQLE
jgi:hypothetical protein